MTQISNILVSDLIETQKTELQELRQRSKIKKILINLSPSDFKELFIIQANKIIAGRNIRREFELTEQNKAIINQIYYYCSGNKEKFNGEIEKGILLVGRNGVGKTLILKSFFNIIQLTTNKIITQIHSKKLQSEIRANGSDYYERRPLFIDDMGKESKEVNDYGTKILPISDLMALRYDNGALTFATCNYKIDTLTEFYGITTTDRFKEMFNIIELKGNSFRR